MKNDKKSNIIQIISNRYNDLNETHKKISDFILQNLETATFSSLFEISKEIGVSDTTLVRFAREVGFKGYQELRESLIDYIRKILYPSYKSSLLNEQDHHPFIEVVMKKDMEYIAKTMSKIDFKSFDKLIDFVLSARLNGRITRVATSAAANGATPPWTAGWLSHSSMLSRSPGRRA